MSDHVVARKDELASGDRLVIHLEGKEIGVFSLGNEYYAYTNWCPHQGGPCCDGSIDGTVSASFDRETLETRFLWTKQNEVLRCPWHSWEFDIRTGACLHNEHRLISYPARVENDHIIVTL